MTSPGAFDQDSDLPPPGSRSGCGVQSVLPYLARTLQAKPANAPEPRETRPVAPPAWGDRPGGLPGTTDSGPRAAFLHGAKLAQPGPLRRLPPEMLARCCSQTRICFIALSEPWPACPSD